MNLVVTGSSSGIGKFLADTLAAGGHQICRLARSPQTGFALKCDVSDWKQVAECAARVGEKWQHVDGIICCAAVQGAIGPAMEMDPAQWQKTLGINLDGTFFTLRAFYPLFSRAPRRAKVICFSGGGSTAPRPNFAAYGVSKTGVLRLVETLATEWQQQPVDINAIAPGAVATRMTEEVLAAGAGQAGQKEIEQAGKLSRDDAKTLERIKGLVEYLLSEKSDGISGKLISAPWDPWQDLLKYRDELAKSDIYNLRRVVPEDRGKKWN